VQVAVIHDIRLKELRLFTDAGRAARPLFIVDNQRLNIKKADIVQLQVRLGVVVGPCSGRSLLIDMGRARARAQTPRRSPPTTHSHRAASPAHGAAPASPLPCSQCPLLTTTTLLARPRTRGWTRC
jgi:hypothetical protein